MMYHYIVIGEQRRIYFDGPQVNPEAQEGAQKEAEKVDKKLTFEDDEKRLSTGIEAAEDNADTLFTRAAEGIAKLPQAVRGTWQLKFEQYKQQYKQIVAHRSKTGRVILASMSRNNIPDDLRSRAHRFDAYSHKVAAIDSLIRSMEEQIIEPLSKVEAKVEGYGSASERGFREQDRQDVFEKHESFMTNTDTQFRRTLQNISKENLSAFLATAQAEINKLNEIKQWYIEPLTGEDVASFYAREMKLDMWMDSAKGRLNIIQHEPKKDPRFRSKSPNDVLKRRSAYTSADVRKQPSHPSRSVEYGIRAAETAVGIGVERGLGVNFCEGMRISWKMVEANDSNITQGDLYTRAENVLKYLESRGLYDTTKSPKGQIPIGLSSGQHGDYIDALRVVAALIGKAKSIPPYRSVGDEKIA